MPLGRWGAESQQIQAGYNPLVAAQGCLNAPQGYPLGGFQQGYPPGGFQQGYPPGGFQQGYPPGSPYATAGLNSPQVYNNPEPGYRGVPGTRLFGVQPHYQPLEPTACNSQENKAGFSSKADPTAKKKAPAGRRRVKGLAGREITLELSDLMLVLVLLSVVVAGLTVSFFRRTTHMYGVSYVLADAKTRSAIAPASSDTAVPLDRTTTF
jgi:hypothetical protein